jgi:hypothetical protein
MKVKTLQKHFTPIASHWTSVRRNARGATTLRLPGGSFQRRFVLLNVIGRR